MQAYFERAFTTAVFRQASRCDSRPSPGSSSSIPQNWLAYNLRGEDVPLLEQAGSRDSRLSGSVVALKPDFAQAYCNMAFALRAARQDERSRWLAPKMLRPRSRRARGGRQRVFANIQAKEEQAARDMAARWGGRAFPASSSSDSLILPSSPAGGGCSFTSYGACNAEKAGDRWAAERIERGTASGSEKAWYGR